MQGKIIKGIAGFYYVAVGEPGIYECKARGVFRMDHSKPLVGDNVEIDIISQSDRTGNIVRILPRRNSLIRPAVANIDTALVIFAVKTPEPNRGLLDRFLIMMQMQNIPTSICFNKCDLLENSDLDRFEEMKQAYVRAGYPVFEVSAAKNTGTDELKKHITGQTVTVAGPSGVGKSSLINLLQPSVHMETGSISEKIDRGKHTTRHAELIPIDSGTFICDTPGFSSLELYDIEAEELWKYYPEFLESGFSCRYSDCIHVNEPDCCIKEKVMKGSIARSRYESYLEIYGNLKNKKKTY